MAFFSALLKEFVENSGFTHAYFAKICGIDRSVLQKYLSGKRLPGSGQIVGQMSEKLHLDPDEHRMLMEEYRKELLGREMDNLLLAARGINRKYIVVGGTKCRERENGFWG